MARLVMAQLKPFKIWNGDRTVKKSLAASSLDDLLHKGRTKLGFEKDKPSKLVLDTDGTEVDEEDYFIFLPSHTTFILLHQDEKWQLPRSADQGSYDEMDCGINDISERVKILVAGLQEDFSRIITFSNDDLQKIVSMKTETVAELMQDSTTLATTFQEACQHQLDDREQTTEAFNLLKVYHKARQNSPYVGDIKRKKKSDN